MSNQIDVSIHITLKAVNNAVIEPPTLPEPSNEQHHCAQFMTCSNPICAKHGCISILRAKTKEMRHV